MAGRVGGDGAGRDRGILGLLLACNAGSHLQSLLTPARSRTRLKRALKSKVYDKMGSGIMIAEVDRESVRRCGSTRGRWCVLVPCLRSPMDRVHTCESGWQSVASDGRQQVATHMMLAEAKPLNALTPSLPDILNSSTSQAVDRQIS